MKKYCKNKGLTLIELLLASILMGIVMAGVVSFTVSIQNQQNAANKIAQLTAKATAVANDIKREASTTIGDASNPGIWCFADGPGNYAHNGQQCEGDTNDNMYLCFRNKENPSDPSNPTIGDYSDDKWTCYYQNSFDNSLWKCNNIFNNNPTYAGTPQYSDVNNCSTEANRTKVLDMTNASFPKMIYDSSNQHVISAEITLEAIDDPEKDPHPILNPEYDVKFYVSPPGQSM